MEKMYLCIDLKSFYASVECVERGHDPMTENLIVADPTRTEKTICLAISPAMKKLGVKNRCRVFEIPKHINYITAPPRMQLYIDYAAEIYGIYLKYVAKEDIHVYSIDEVFLDVTAYLSLYHTTPQELGKTIVNDIKHTVGVGAACGIGTNMYLAKIALDITAKHTFDNMGYLDEELYKKTLWDYKPITHFWRVGEGTAKRLADMGIYTMGQIANADEDKLYKKFGVDAELLIDHAWGKEPVTIADIKAYKPKTNCLTSGQVLMSDYAVADAEIIIKEMMDSLCLDMVEKNLVTRSVTITIIYARHLNAPSATGTISSFGESNADTVLIPAAVSLYRKIVNPSFLVRKINITCNNVREEKVTQLSMFGGVDVSDKSRKIQKTMLAIKKKFGENAVLKAMDLDKKATARERNLQIGGHKSGKEKD